MGVMLPFCVLEKAFVIWGADVERGCEEFLSKVDADFYLRSAHMLISVDNVQNTLSTLSKTEDQSRKDISSLARMLWHHGLETLVMFLGAYIQAPGAPAAYFLKCRTDDAIEIARAILAERRLKYNRLSDAPFTLTTLLNGIHLHAGWPDRSDTIDKFHNALRGMLVAFTDDDHRAEYNSIKHGLRAYHGQFVLAAGIEETPGVAAPPEAMEFMGASRDASFFALARPLKKSANQYSKVNFKLEDVALPWSLEKVLCDLQVIALLVGNVVSALRITGGAKHSSVKFHRPADADEWWKTYASYGHFGVTRFGSTIEIETEALNLPTSDQVRASYKR